MKAYKTDVPKTELCLVEAKLLGAGYGESAITVRCDKPKGHLPEDEHQKTVKWRAP